MDILRCNALKNMNEVRQNLVRLEKEALTAGVLQTWVANSIDALTVAGRLAGSTAAAVTPARMAIEGHQNETDTTVLDAVRDVLLKHVDETIHKLDRTYMVRPVLDELILKVKDSKLATLLNEFNVIKESSANIAAIGFRTILCLVIVEIAKVRNPSGKVAQRQDLALDPIIKEALAEKVFNQAEQRLVERFRDGPKTKFDIVAHKMGDNALLDKDDLSNAIDNVLNELLKALRDSK